MAEAATVQNLQEEEEKKEENEDEDEEQEEELEPGATLEELLAGNPRLSRADIDHLQQWLATQPHLPPLLDKELVPFLVSCGYSLERAKECVDKCFTLRTHAPELFSGRDPDDPLNREQFLAFRVAVLPRRTPGGQRVVAMGYAPQASFDAARFDGERSLRLTTALMELLGVEEAAQAEAAAGLALVLDAANVTMGHMARTPLGALQRLMVFVQEAAPMRIAAVHVVHLGPVGQRVLSMLRPLMSEQLQNVTHFHTGAMGDFYAEFPRDILPEDLGGTCGNMADYHNELVAQLKARRGWLLAQEARVVDEKKRRRDVNSPRRDASLFGASGSFRQLCID